MTGNDVDGAASAWTDRIEEEGCRGVAGQVFSALEGKDSSLMR